MGKAKGKSKGNKKLYERMRVSGVRKRVARELSQLPRMGSGGKRVPKGVRQTFERLQAVVSELEGHAGRSDRKASARKAARTRRSKAKRRSSSARKASRTRART
jgi:hypothetical protein